MPNNKDIDIIAESIYDPTEDGQKTDKRIISKLERYKQEIDKVNKAVGNFLTFNLKYDVFDPIVTPKLPAKAIKVALALQHLAQSKRSHGYHGINNYDSKYDEFDKTKKLWGKVCDILLRNSKPETKVVDRKPRQPVFNNDIKKQSKFINQNDDIGHGWDL